MVGVDEWARQWVEANNAVIGPELTLISPDTTIRSWRGVSSACDVVFYRVEGAGHTWPGSNVSLPRVLFGRTSRTFDATRVIWSFVSAHVADVTR
jgi:polyhydroxybutyrate depolymerase